MSNGVQLRFPFRVLFQLLQTISLIIIPATFRQTVLMRSVINVINPSEFAEAVKCTLCNE